MLKSYEFNNITIVITIYKSGSKLINCLKTIHNQCPVIIIDNSSDINLKKKIESEYSNVTYIVCDQNLGYAKGNNLGLSKVLTKYALILNPDAYLNKNTLKNFFITANKIVNFAIIAPAAQNIDSKKNKYLEISEVDAVKGFAMFLKIEEFKEIGFFDENFFIYLEEIDLCKRIKKAKKKIYIDSSVIIDHQGGSSHEEEYNLEMELSRNWHWMWSTFYFNKKYYGFLKAFIFVSGKLASSAFKYCFFSIIFKNTKKLIYKQRFLGLFNSILNKPSWYRPFKSN